MSALIPLSVLLGAYLLGAIPFGLLIARRYGVSDIRALGSGNIGATNVWRIVGAKAAIWVYILDIGKGVVAVLVARAVVQTMIPRDLFLVLAALAAVLGHVFPVYLGFRGGKGVNTALGVILTLLPVEAVVGLAVFIIVVAISRWISLGSILASACLACVVLAERELLGKPISIIFVVFTVLLALMVLFTHRKNITRILNGTENRFSFSSGSSRSGVGHHA